MGRLLSFLLGIAVAAALGVTGSSVVRAVNYQGWVSEQHNTSINTATGNVCGTNSNATYAVIQIKGATAYYTYNGSTPSSTNGFQLSALQQFGVYGADLINRLQFIGAGATLEVVCTQ